MNDYYINQNIECLNKLKYDDNIIKIYDEMLNCINNKGKILFIGNGGSASDSIHIVSDLTDDYHDENKTIKAIALTSNISSITAISNDCDFDLIFEKQINIIGDKNDILISLSTSGLSKNILNGIKKAKSRGIKTILVTGNKKSFDADINLCISSNDKTIVQNMYMIIFHLLCNEIKRAVLWKLELILTGLLQTLTLL